MPTYKYPGVYVEEIPSDVRTITGVSTSDTAFIDFFARGPVDQAVRITSLADFGRIFGGLDRRSEASYAIQQYFLNGGSVAWVVRVLAGDFQTASVVLDGGSPPQRVLAVKASSPGQWGNSIQVAVDWKTPQEDQFNLIVEEFAIVRGRKQTVASEIHRNLSTNLKSPRYAVQVVESDSALVRLESFNSLGERPNETGFVQLGQASTPSGGTTGDPSSGPSGNAAGTDGTEPGQPGWEAPATNAIVGDAAKQTGLYALERIEPYIFNILCIPAVASFKDEGNIKKVLAQAIQLCTDKRAFMLVDPPPGTTKEKVVTWLGKLSVQGETNAAIYFPRLSIPDPLNENRPRDVGASGTLAGIYARTDASRGVWKAPAGIDATLRGASVTQKLTDIENGDLNVLGINVLRNFPIYGNVSWGARTLDGADQQASEWKYIPVRRTALFLEESLFQGLKWVVFEPNDEPLWSQIRLNVGAFMQNLFRQGAFQGKSPKDAYFVKCDSETTTQNDINLGIVNIIIGFAPLKPAEFVVLKFQQMTGQIAT